MNLWPHQQAAVEFVVRQWATQPGALLDMEMGTGKTLTTLALLGYEWRTLVLCPKSVRAVWAREAVKWDRPDQWCIPQGSGRHKALAIRSQRNGATVLNYEALLSPELMAAVQATRWDAVVFDESHRLKAPFGAASKLARKIRAPRRLALTGTPMPHSPLDVWAQAQALQLPQLGTSFTRFRARYAKLKLIPGVPAPIVDGFQNLDELRGLMAQFTFQARAADVLTLPGAEDVVRPVQLDRELRHYLSMSQHLVAEIGAGVVTASNALDKLLRLQQLTGGCLAGERVGEAKLDALRDILDDLPPGEPVVVFARFSDDLRAVNQAAVASERPYFELSGQANQLAAWQAAQGGGVLGVQIQAGGVGIDATRARFCVYYSVGFSLGDYLQSRARTLRPGQTRDVRYFHLVAQGTVDERVYAALKDKRDIVAEVLDGLGKTAKADCAAR